MEDDICTTLAQEIYRISLHEDSRLIQLMCSFLLDLVEFLLSISGVADEDVWEFCQTWNQKDESVLGAYHWEEEDPLDDDLIEDLVGGVGVAHQ